MIGGGDKAGKRRGVVILSLLLTSFFHSSGSLLFRKIKMVWNSICSHLKIWSRSWLSTTGPTYAPKLKQTNSFAIQIVYDSLKSKIAYPGAGS